MDANTFDWITQAIKEYSPEHKLDAKPGVKRVRLSSVKLNNAIKSGRLEKIGNILTQKSSQDFWKIEKEGDKEVIVRKMSDEELPIIEDSDES